MQPTNTLKKYPRIQKILSLTPTTSKQAQGEFTTKWIKEGKIFWKQKLGSKVKAEKLESKIEVRKKRAAKIQEKRDVHTKEAKSIRYKKKQRELNKPGKYDWQSLN